MSTKDAILDTALSLFNREGTQAITTNHIASEMGISPGNLYYHFRDKGEIISTLFERLFAAWDTGFQLPTGHQPDLNDLQRLVTTNFEILWNYRFIYRELNALLQRDAALQERFVEVRLRGFQGFRQLFDAFVLAGQLKAPQDAGEIDALAQLCWMISEFWLPTLEISGEQVTQKQLQRGAALMMQTIKPYLS